MAESELTTAASADDAYQQFGQATNLTDVTNRVISSATETSRYWAGARWVISISQNSTINWCHISLYVYDLGLDDANFDIYFEKLAAPAAFTTGVDNIVNRTRTTNSVPWVEDGINIPGDAYYDSADLATPAQEVASAFNITAMAVILVPKSDVAKQLRYIAFDYGSLMPKLHINWTEPSGWTGEFAGVAVSEFDGVTPAEIDGV